MTDNSTNVSGLEKSGVSGRNAFKIGCMAALGVFAACFLVFCAVPAACVMGTATVATVSAPAEIDYPSITRDEEIIIDTDQETPSASTESVATPTLTPNPNLTPNIEKIIAAARQKQYNQAIPFKNHYDYWTSQAEMLQRHKKQAELQHALQQQEMYRQQYMAIASEEYFQKMVADDTAKEQRRLNKLEAERIRAIEEAPIRERARKEAERDRVYDQEYNRTYRAGQ